jgi:murein endopeptidase
MKTEKIKEQVSKVEIKIVPGQSNNGSTLTHGSKRYSHKHKAHIINPDNLHDRIQQSDYLRTETDQNRQHGHPDVIEVAEEAVKAVHEYLSTLKSVDLPKFLVKDISPSNEWIKKNCRTEDDPETVDYDESRAGCQFAGHISHVTGMDLDLCFLYQHKGKNGYKSKNIEDPQKISELAVLENLFLLDSLSRNPKVELVIVSDHILSELRRNKKIIIERYEKLIKEKEVPDWYPTAGKDPAAAKEDFDKKLRNIVKQIKELKTTKISTDAKGDSAKPTSGHWRHFHIRVKMPTPDTQAKDASRAPTVSQPDSQSKIKDLLKENVSYTFGYANGQILEYFNQDKKMHGASMQKLPALLVNLFIHNKNSEERLTVEEMALLLAYQTGKIQINGGGRGQRKANGTHSNHIMRYLQRSKHGTTKNNKPWNTYTGNRGPLGKKKLPQITRSDFDSWSDNLGFGQSTIGGSEGGNQQTTKDMFKLFSALYSSSQSEEGVINQEDAKTVLSLMNRDLSYFKEKFQKEDAFFTRGQKGEESKFDREIWNIRESPNDSLKHYTENYLRSKGSEIQIDKIFGKGGIWKTLNYGVILEIQGTEYVFVCYTQRSGFASLNNNKKFIANLLGRVLMDHVRASKED